MTEAAADPSPIKTAVDNDVILKAVCYGLTSTFWPACTRERVGVLGVARYVITRSIEKADLNGDKAVVQAGLSEFLGDSTVLEPTDDEVQLAAEMEREAQEAGLALDAGESQLCSMNRSGFHAGCLV